MIKDNDITGAGYWDSWWSSRAGEAEVLLPHLPEFGRRGYFLRAIERHTGPLQGKSVVELGGALSYGLVAMAKWRGVRATVIDYSPASIRPTKHFFAANGCEVNCIAADFFSPEVADLRFDLVTHWGVLEHQRDPFPLIELSARLCAPGGQVIFSMPQMKGFAARRWKRQNPENWARHIYHSDETIIRAFERVGFKAKPIFWGEPYLQINGLPLSGFLPRILSKAQYCFHQLDRYGLSPYQFGSRYLSYVRGFVAHLKTP